MPDIASIGVALASIKTATEIAKLIKRLFIILCQVNFTDRYGFLSAPQNGLRAVIASNSSFGWDASSAQRPSIYPRKAA